ncbi:MAG: hypothetical protein KDC44_11390, partial [Phaeodactylibacter sp.]|nr:hypothetical protein [Phaeodactylibacter sp.]
MEDPEKLIEEAENLIADSRLELAAKKLLAFFRWKQDEELVDEVLLILSRHSNFIRKAELQGVVDIFDVEYGKIRLAVIQLKKA